MSRNYGASCDKCMDHGELSRFSILTDFGITYLYVLAKSNKYKEKMDNCVGCAKIYAVNIRPLIKLLYELKIVKKYK